MRSVLESVTILRTGRVASALGFPHNNLPSHQAILPSHGKSRQKDLRLAKLLQHNILWRGYTYKLEPIPPHTIMYHQDLLHAHSLNAPQEFWDKEAAKLHWEQPPSSVLDVTYSPTEKKWKWFNGGRICTTHNMLTRHVRDGNGNRTAIIYDSPVTNTHDVRITYAELLEEVQALAGVLRGMGVNKGGRVLVYMPMIPQAIIGILATVHVGAVHSVVFGGFAAAECAKRITNFKPDVILTASCGIEGGKRRIIPYVPILRQALEQSGIQTQGGCKLLVWQRPELVEMLQNGERDWKSTLDRLKNRWRNIANNKLASRLSSIAGSENGEMPEEQWEPVAEGVSVDANDPIYIIYTSGTTDVPKGVVRYAGGHAVGLHFQLQFLFGINAGDIIFTASDIGWVVGHSFIVYAPLLRGATTVLFEGKPVGTPSADTFWRIIEQYKVNVLFTAPTALRAIRREDPHHEFFIKRDLRSLRGLFLAGERSEAGIITEFQNLLDQYGASGARIVDNWWTSESGSPMTGIALGVKEDQVPLKPGSCGKPMPGWDVRVVGDNGEELSKGDMGNIVLGIPLGPTGFSTLWQDETRFKRGYLDRFNGRWIDTGDAGIIDDQGYVHIMSRTDDIINVAAHRFSTGAIEQAILSHPLVAECCVIGLPDALKGHVPFAFVGLMHDAVSSPPNEEQFFKELNTIVREQIGAIASLGGLIYGLGVIPKTRSGKSVRRVLRELIENASQGQFDKDPIVPATIEDMGVVQTAKQAVKDYYHNGKKVKAKL